MIGAVGVCHAAPDTRPLFRDFMGINGHTVQFRPQLYQPVASLVRDYHPAEWDLGKDSDFAPPFPSARNGVDWRTVYGSWRKAGWRVDVSCMFETLPRTQWKNLAADSQAYAERLARSLGPSGTNALVESVEIGNEPGKFSDADYRTLFENMARGLKAGDPRVRVVTGAMTTGKSHDYAKSVECIAGLEKLYDVLNVHSYAQLEGWPTWRRSYPEDARLKDYLPDITRLCKWRDEHAPGKDVWLTEFGYDASTRAPDPKTEFKQWVGVTDEKQAQWTVRSWLVFATLPIQRAYLYFFNDNDAPQIHGSSGLTRNFQPKPAFYAAAHLQRTLGDYRFSQVLIDRPGEVELYEFNHATDIKRKIWVAWSPTGSGRTANFDLPAFDGVIEKAERMPLLAGEKVLIEIPPTTRQIAIGESPVFLFLKKGQ
jgi:serine/threonine-protein kinase ATR